MQTEFNQEEHSNKNREEIVMNQDEYDHNEAMKKVEEHLLAIAAGKIPAQNDTETHQEL